MIKERINHTKLVSMVTEGVKKAMQIAQENQKLE